MENKHPCPNCGASLGETEVECPGCGHTDSDECDCEYCTSIVAEVEKLLDDGGGLVQD